MPGTHTGAPPCSILLLSLTPAPRTAVIPHLHPAQVNRGRSQVQGHPSGEGRCISGCCCEVEIPPDRSSSSASLTSSQRPGWAGAGLQEEQTPHKMGSLAPTWEEGKIRQGAWLALISQLLEEEMKAAINCTRRVVCAA